MAESSQDTDKNTNSSDSDLSLDCPSEKFDPIKVLYSRKLVLPKPKAPLYNNLAQFLAAQKPETDIVPVGNNDAVQRKEKEKQEKKEQMYKEIMEKNEKRFANMPGLTHAPRPAFVVRNLLVKCERQTGPLHAIKDCMDSRIRVKVIIRNATGIRGHMVGLLQAFDKYWNLALSDVLETWTRRARSKSKIPPNMGEQCPKGTAQTRSHIPAVTERILSKGVVECCRHIPQIMVRGEHVVLINILKDS